MEVRSSRRVRTLVTQMARSGLSANEIAPALIPMMTRSETLQSKAGYIDARPLPPYRQNSLATHGRTIHSGHSRSAMHPGYCSAAIGREWDGHIARSDGRGVENRARRVESSTDVRVVKYPDLCIEVALSLTNGCRFRDERPTSRS